MLRVAIFIFALVVWFFGMWFRLGWSPCRGGTGGYLGVRHSQRPLVWVGPVGFFPFVLGVNG